MSIGGNSGTFVFSSIKTEWADIDSISYPWVCQAERLTGKTIDIELIGSLLGQGNVDIKMTFIDDTGETRVLVSKLNISSSGLQVTGLKVRGKLKLMPGARMLTCSMR